MHHAEGHHRLGHGLAAASARPLLCALVLAGTSYLGACNGCGKGGSSGPGPGGDDDSPAAQLEFGAPCAAASDCVSGLCIETVAGAFCSRDCSEGCPDAWDCKLTTGTSLEGTTVCVPGSNNLCLPCAGDRQCNVAGDLCLEIGAGRYCGRDCSAAACPAGYSCRDMPHGDATARQCVPDNNSCDCDEEAAGRTRGCASSNEHGTCYGSATCDPAHGWVGCDAATATAELCSGIDDDCDGFIDDADAGVAYPGEDPSDASCAYGVGCTGTYRCEETESGVFAWSCVISGDLTETCDGLDNDCDGEVDDGFASFGANGLVYDLTIEHCGGCGNDCRLLVPRAAETACVREGPEAHCAAVSCLAGSYLDAGGRSCSPLVPTLCAPCATDTDCHTPGSRCIAMTGGSFCGQDCSSASVFPCAGEEGSEDCCGVGFLCASYDDGSEVSLQCQPTSGTCTCSALTGGLVRQCFVPRPGDPAGSCRGLQHCAATDGFAWSACSVDPTAVELCNGLDDDCDGGVDEDFVDQHGTGTYDTDEHCGMCFNDCQHRWDPYLHNAAGGCDVSTIPFTCEMVCASELGWVDANQDPDDGCECQAFTSRDPPDTELGGYPDETTRYVDSNCDGIDGVIGDALFVSAAALGPGTGSIDDPYLTIAQALAALAASGKSYILVAGGIYQEQLVLDAGVELHGGYAADFRTRDIILYPTVVAAPEPTFAAGYRRGTVSIECDRFTDTGSVLLSGFTIYGYEVTTRPGAGLPGHSSYAVYLRDCGVGVQVINNAIIGGLGGPAGNGEDGARGYGAGDAGSAALDGANGARHPSSCVRSPSSGGNLSEACDATLPNYPGLGEACTDLSELTAGGAGGQNSSPGCENCGHSGGRITCPRYYNDPDFYAGSLTETHKGFQAEYRSCTTTLPDCCPYSDPVADPTVPLTCADTPYVCVVPEGHAGGVCARKRPCSGDEDCPVRYTCASGFCAPPSSCSVDPDCASGYFCSNGACTPGVYGVNGAGAFDNNMNVARHACNQITESGFPSQIDPLAGAAGTLGATGHSGAAGLGCQNALGSIIGDEWVGDGGAGGGGRGQPGQPGGGGGAGAGIAYHNTGTDGDCLRYEIGASGGGGGAGGCGGEGAGAGASGGASIALFLYYSSPPDPSALPTLRDNFIRRGEGGAGGRGGNGASGGFGGNGGVGAVEIMAWGLPYAAGDGGRGGSGGSGGGGGGGCGGASIGIALWNVPVDPTSAGNQFDAGLPPMGGAGGPGGASPDAMQQGVAGLAGHDADLVAACESGTLCPQGTACDGGVCR